MNQENLIIKDAVTSFSKKDLHWKPNPILRIDVTYTAEEAHLNREDADVTWDLSIQIHDLESGKSYNTFTQRGRWL